MPERRMTQIVRQRYGLDQIFIELQSAGDGATQLRHLKRVRHPRAKEIAFMVQEHLRLVNQAPERGGMHDTVAIALERIACGCGGFFMPTPP